MKRKRIIPGIAALLLAWSMMLAGCGGIDTIEGRMVEEDGSSDSDNNGYDYGNNAVEDENISDDTTGYTENDTKSTEGSGASEGSEKTHTGGEVSVDLADIPEYSGSPYVVINGNTPYFSDSDMTTASYESYSSLDTLGRCGVCMACVGQDIMPTEERGSIGSVKPTGWHTVKYDCVDGKYLYNRCHLLGYQLTGENANERNLITGTRYMNVEGMLPFENMVADHVKETGEHVLYRVTPLYEGDNLLASGVLMEAMSVEDEGAAVLFNVFCYNVQPGIEIDYATGESEYTGIFIESASAYSGDSYESGTAQITDTSYSNSETHTYILNVNTKKFHYPDCKSVKKMSESNKQQYTGTREEVTGMGYSPCGNCNP